jgi:hypothetical protein
MSVGSNPRAAAYWVRGIGPKLLSIAADVVRRSDGRPAKTGRSEGRRTMSQYLILIYEDESGYANATPEVIGEVMEGHNAFGEANAKAIQGGNALQPTSTATTVRPDGAGGFTVTDGPFLETKEALGGYYLVEAADLDEAIALAKQVPAKFGVLEVRPIMVFA